VGHAHVGNNQIDGLGFQQVEPCLPAFGSDNGKAMGAKQAAQRRQDAGFVIHT